MARPTKQSKPSPTGSGDSGSGVSAQIAQVGQQIESEKLQQKQNQLSAEKVRTKITEVAIEIAEVSLETKQTSKEIASVRGEKERHSLTDAENQRDLTQQLGEIRKEFNEEKIARERRRLYEFEGVEV